MFNTNSGQKNLKGNNSSNPSGFKKEDGPAKSVYAQKGQAGKKFFKRGGSRPEIKDEFDQRIIDLARVTRVMAGGKRMRFRACVAIGNKAGKIGLGMAKGADVTAAVNKAVNKAKKNIIEIPIINETIPHEIYHKMGAAKILMRPSRKGRGVIAGSAARVIFELGGIKNITSKILGTNNKVNVAKCTIEALNNLKKVEKKNTEDAKEEVNVEEVKIDGESEKIS
jgi:small subunit ribosomal protein S5